MHVCVHVQGREYSQENLIFCSSLSSFNTIILISFFLIFNWITMRCNYKVVEFSHAMFNSHFHKCTFPVPNIPTFPPAPPQCLLLLDIVFNKKNLKEDLASTYDLHHLSSHSSTSSEHLLASHLFQYTHLPIP